MQNTCNCVLKTDLTVLSIEGFFFAFHLHFWFNYGAFPPKLQGIIYTTLRLLYIRGHQLEDSDLEANAERLFSRQNLVKISFLRQLNSECALSVHTII